MRERYRIKRDKEGSFWRGRVKALIVEKDTNTPKETVVLFPGLLANRRRKVFKRTARELVKQAPDKRVIALAYTGLFRSRRLSKAAHEMFPTVPVKAQNKRIPRRLEYNRAAAALRYLDKRNLKNVRGIAHSLGEQTAIIAHHLDKKRPVEKRVIKKIEVGITPTGVSKRYPMKWLTTRFLLNTMPEMFKGMVRKESAITMLRLQGGLVAAAAHPIQLWTERKTIKNANITNEVAWHKIPVLVGSTDSVFGDKELSRNPEIQRRKKVFKGGHNRVLTHPKEFVRNHLV